MNSRSRIVFSALSAAALLGVVAVVADSERLPAWSWSIGGVTAAVGPGRQPIPTGDDSPGSSGSTDGSQGERSGRNGGPANSVSSASSTQSTVGAQHTFATYAEAEAFATQARVHVLAPQWVPADFAPQSLGVTLSVLPPETAAALGRAQRVAVTQRFVAPDATITVVQSSPPSFFDLLLDSGSPQDDLPLSNGLRARLGQFPQGVIVYWRERGDVRSIGVIGDQGAAARLTRDDWQRLADSLS